MEGAREPGSLGLMQCQGRETRGQRPGGARRREGRATPRALVSGWPQAQEGCRSPGGRPTKGQADVLCKGGWTPGTTVQGTGGPGGPSGEEGGQQRPGEGTPSSPSLWGLRKTSLPGRRAGQGRAAMRSQDPGKGLSRRERAVPLTRSGDSNVIVPKAPLERGPCQ